MKKARYYLTELFFSVEFLKYFVTGVIATIVNVLVYMLMNRWLGLDKWYYSDVPAIVLSVLSAYVLNRLWVFRSTSSVWQEFIRFVGTRLAISFFFEYAGIYLMNHLLRFQVVLIPDMLDLAKLIALTFVVLANRVSGKFYVFRPAPAANNPGSDPQVLLDRAIAMIQDANKFPDSDKRDRGAVLYRELGDPWRSCPAFHIAGTNGKGSISSYLTHILCHAGHKVGWYTSPYLERFNERVRVLDGPGDLARYDRDQTFGEIPDDDMVRLMGKIGEAARLIAARDGIASTQFDMMTALAFLWFEEEACDLMVLETGMGGRLDSTNVIEKPLASLIGALGFDHMERLGETMEEIAGEKAGIIKQGCPVFAYAPEDALLASSDAAAARQVLDQRCLAMAAPLTYFGYRDFDLLSYGWAGQEFRTKKEGHFYTTRLLGPYQPIYALMAAEAALISGMADRAAAERGIADCVWPARMEVLSQDPLILLDGAHNVQAGLGLREALGKLAADRPIVFVVGLLQDKEHREMLKALFLDPPYTVTQVVATEPPDARRFEAAELAAELSSILAEGQAVPVTALPDIGQAMAEAVSRARETGAMVCVCGSLYLAGMVRPLVRQGLKG